MIRFRLFLRLPCLLPLAAILAAGCSGGVNWTDHERENAAHIEASLRATSDAAVIANGIENRSDLERDRERLLQALRAAHLHAARVEDSVLDKLHPRMYGKFRLEYQPALAGMLRAYESGDLDAAQTAAAGIRDFMTWYRNEKHTFRWWDNAAPR